MRYKNGDIIEIGDIFTDGSSGSEDIRLKNRAKVLYVDKFNLVWFPLNDFTTHTNYKKEKYTSKTWTLSSNPIKINITELTDEELEMYNSADLYIK